MWLGQPHLCVHNQGGGRENFPICSIWSPSEEPGGAERSCGGTDERQEEHKEKMEAEKVETGTSRWQEMQVHSATADLLFIQDMHAFFISEVDPGCMRALSAFQPVAKLTPRHLIPKLCSCRTDTEEA